jgi:hypothetical protein
VNIILSIIEALGVCFISQSLVSKKKKKSETESDEECVKAFLCYPRQTNKLQRADAFSISELVDPDRTEPVKTVRSPAETVHTTGNAVHTAGPVVGMVTLLSPW